MLPIPSFDPGDTILYPSGSGTINVGAADAGSKILFYNESFYNILIDFLNGSQEVLHAWEARWWPLDADTKELQWKIDSVLSALASPIRMVMGTLYRPGEQIPGTYPISLTRQTNIGNTVNTVSGSSSSVQNDNNIAGTSVVESTVSGDSASAVSLTNSGQMSLGTTAHPGSLQIHGINGTTGWLDNSGDVTVGNGTKINANLIVALPNNDIGLHVELNQAVVITVNGVNMVRFINTGVQYLDPGAQALANGSTITITGTFVPVTCATSVTGIIMTPGSANGHFVLLYNGGPGTLTFANTGSNVRKGSTIVVDDGQVLIMTWKDGAWGNSKA